MTVRRATVEDFPQIAVLGERFWHTTTLANFANFDQESFITSLGVIYDSGGLIAVAEEGDVIQGAIIAIIEPWVFNLHCSVVSEIGWYVSPECRKKGCGLQLLEALHAWAKDQGANIVIMASTQGPRRAIAKKIYERRGYTHVDDIYIREV